MEPVTAYRTLFFEARDPTLSPASTPNLGVEPAPAEGWRHELARSRLAWGDRGQSMKGRMGLRW
jgi:hypothetical protein